MKVLAEPLKDRGSLSHGFDARGRRGHPSLKCGPIPFAVPIKDAVLGPLSARNHSQHAATLVNVESPEWT